MYNEYLAYQRLRRKSNRQGFLATLLIYPLMFIVLFTVVGIMAAPPLGIAIGVACFFFLRLVIKAWKRYLDSWKKVKAYRATFKGWLTKSGGATYCFVAPFSTQESLNLIGEVISSMGEVKNVDRHHGTLTAKLLIPIKKKVPVIFYVERNDDRCKVRACFDRSASDDWWDFFLEALFEKYPGVDFGVSLAKGDPMVAGVLDLSGDTHEIHTSVTSGGTSLGGFLIGGALFGDAGAVVGGLSGKQRTVTNSRTEYSSTLLARVIYSNGRLWEGLVYKKSQLYNEIMLLSV